MKHHGWSTMATAGSSSAGTGVGPSCSIPAALPGGLALGRTDAALSPGPGIQTSQREDALRAFAKWAQWAFWCLQLVCTDAMRSGIFFQSVAKSKVPNIVGKENATQPAIWSLSQLLSLSAQKSNFNQFSLGCLFNFRWTRAFSA